MQTSAKDDFVIDATVDLAAHSAAAADPIATLTSHWPEYLMESASLGLFMISACSFTVLLQHPGSILRQMLPGGFERRLLTGAGHGVDGHRPHLLPLGKAIRRTSESVSNSDASFACGRSSLGTLYTTF